MSNKITVKADIPQTVNYQTCTVEVGDTQTLEPFQNATVTNSGTKYNAVFDFSIPRGKSAYEQAVEGGYSGTEEEFKQILAADLNTVADNVSDINDVAQNIEDISSVADNLSDVATVSNNVTNINTVAGISSDVTQVSGISNAVQTVSNHDGEVTLVATNMANVATTASNIGDVNTVAGISTDVSTVAGNNSNVTAVAGNATNINAVANNASNVNTVANNISDVNTVATNISDISNVNNNLTIIQEVSENMDDVIAAADAVEEVLPHITEINNVSDNISEVVAVANDLTNIDNASTHATNAANSAANASTSATNAATSATNAQKWAEGTDSQVQPLGGTKSAKGWAQRAQEIVDTLGAVMHYKGSVATVEDLPTTGQELGDVWNVLSDGSNYAWDGTDWDAVGGAVDMSAYRTAAEQDVVDATKQDKLTSLDAGTDIEIVEKQYAESEEIVSGRSSLSLTDAKVNGLEEIKLFGGCEQTSTPTPTTPVDIISNNGAIKYSANMCNVNAQTALVGYYISTQGVVTADANNWVYQAFIPVEPNTTYTLSMSSAVYFASISEYSTADDSGFIVRKVSGAGANTQFTITTGATTNFIRFGTNIDRTEVTLEEVLAINWMLNEGDTAIPYAPYVEGGVYTDGTVETVQDSLSNTATAERLLSVANYTDIQSVLDGAVTRNIGIKVLDGTENWVASGNLFYAAIATDALKDTHICYCTHFKGVATNASANYDNEIKVGTDSSATVNWTRVQIYPVIGTYSNVTAFKQWLADQYANGTPVIVVYPLATATTETVTPQTLQTQAGTNTLQITQASINNLALEATYTKLIDIPFKINFKNNTGYTTNKGTVTSVNNTQPDSNGNVNIEALPSQTGQSGKFLTTNGSTASWDDIAVDGKSVTLNSNNEIQTVGVLDQNDTSKSNKTWTGTKAQYDAIATKDADTIYYVTDDVDVTREILNLLYPVGSVYITTNNTCPLGSLISGSSWVLVGGGKVLQGSDSTHNPGTTVEAGLPNITGNFTGLSHGTTDGAFTAGSFLGAFSGSSSGGGAQQNSFDASNSNPIYGNSTTVQPPAYVVNIFRRTA